jgi:hypothetical protein
MKRTALLLIALTLAFPLFAERRRSVLPTAPPCAEAEIASDFIANDLASDATYLYFTNQEGSLYRLAKSGGIAPELLTSISDQIVAIAVDADRIYFATASNDFSNFLASIESLPKNGGTPTLLASNVVAPADLLVDDTYLYWNSTGTPSSDGADVQADGKIEKMRKDGTGRVVLAQNLSFPISIALDGDNVLFGETGLAVGNTAAGLRSVPKAGGAVTSLVDGAPVIGIAPTPATIYFGSVGGLSFAASINALDRATKNVTQLATDVGAIPLTVKVAGDQVYYYLLADEDSIRAVPVTGGSERVIHSGGFSTPEFLVDDCALYYAALDFDTFVGTIRRGPR